MNKPSSIEILKAELAQAERGVVTMKSALGAASANTARADKLEQAAHEELVALEEERADLHADLGGKLAVRIVQGLPDEPITTHTALDAKVQAASIHLTICSNAAARLREIHVASLNGLRSAETAVKKAEAALLDAVNEEKATAILEMMRVVHLKVAELRASVPTGLRDRIDSPLRRISPTVEAALALRPNIDPINLPIPQLRALMLAGEEI